MTQAYPLHWPESWPRHKNPGTSQFKTSLAGALSNVEKSISAFSKDSGKKIESLVISSNVTLGSQRPADAGVALYFTWDGLQTCIAVDRYAKVEDNLQAIHHCLEAERTKLRHGGINLVRAAFRGYAALPPPTTSAAHWSDVLGVDRNASMEQIAAARNAKAKKAHPDAGGSADAMAAINEAYEQAKKERG